MVRKTPRFLGRFDARESHSLLLVASVVLVVAMAPVAAAQGPTVTATGGTAAPGETVTVTIELTDAQTAALENIPSDWVVESHTDAGATFRNLIDEGGTLGWAWSSAQDEKTVSVTFELPDGATSRTLDVTAEALDEPTATTTATVTVERGNTPPTADAGSDRTVTAGTTIALDGTDSSDADGDALTYEWRQTAGPSVALRDAGTATPEFTTPDVDGERTLSFALTVTDPDGATDTDSVSVTVDDAPGSGISVSLEPSSRRVQPGTTTTYELVARNADDGLSAFETSVSLDDGSVATIVDAEIGPPTSFTDVRVTDGGDRVILATVGLNPDDTAEVVLARITIRGDDTGTTGLKLTGKNDYVDDANSEYDASISNATVQVTGEGDTSGLDVTGDGVPATDPDGDGSYEDIDGNGRFTVVDVSALLNNRGTIDNGNVAFDFNGDGGFSVVDVSALLQELEDGGTGDLPANAGERHREALTEAGSFTVNQQLSYSNETTSFLGSDLTSELDLDAGVGYQNGSFNFGGFASVQSSYTAGNTTWQRQNSSFGGVQYSKGTAPTGRRIRRPSTSPPSSGKR